IPEKAALVDATRTRIVILGGGFGGLAAAAHFEAYSGRHAELDVTLVSDSNYSLFTPMLAEVASGSLEPPHISSSVRAFLHQVQFRRAVVTGIDAEQRIVRIQACDTCEPTVLPYDHVLVAVGSIPFDFGLPGIGEHAF